jgi:hypothetical protein
MNNAHPLTFQARNVPNGVMIIVYVVQLLVKDVVRKLYAWPIYTIMAHAIWKCQKVLKV